MFARLAFACAINVDPDILIVDEVLSVGDMAFQFKCFKKFEQFKKNGKTILFVSHSVGDIQRNCTRTIILDCGKKIYDGAVKEGVERYKKIMVGLGGSLDDDEEESITSDKESENTDSNLILIPKVLIPLTAAVIVPLLALVSLLFFPLSWETLGTGATASI